MSQSSGPVLNIGSQAPDVDDLDLTLVVRLTCRIGLYLRLCGISSIEKYFDVENRKSNRCSCNICARAKRHLISFPAVRNSLEGLSLGDRVSAEVLIMQNILTREDNHHVFFIVDHATKMCWVFPLKIRVPSSIPSSRLIVSSILPSMPPIADMLHSRPNIR